MLLDGWEGSQLPQAPLPLLLLLLYGHSVWVGAHEVMVTVSMAVRVTLAAAVAARPVKAIA